MERFVALVILGCPLFATLASAQKLSSEGGSAEHRADVQITGHVFKPSELPAPNLAQLHIPAGFHIEKFAENAGNARVLAVGPDGSIYLTRREQGDVLMFKVGANGLSAGPPKRVASRTGLHGIAISKGKVYLASVHEIFKADLLADGSFGPLEMIIHDLPDAGQHNTRTVQIGPDDMMYISIGSTCNECSEPNPENAAILRASLDGKTRSVFASGLRDTIGWGWHPQTGELWGMDHGIDWLGDNNQPEELNHIEKGKRYGWPYVYGNNEPNPHVDPPGGIRKSEWAKSSTPMSLGYTAHAAPMQMSFYNGGQFPAEFRGDAFVSMRGSWNRKPASGYEVVRIRFRSGSPVAIEPFVTGFVSPEGEYGRLVGNAVAKDGSLLFTDDRNGVIYRLSYTGGSVEGTGTTIIPDQPMLRQNQTGVRSALAMASPQTQTNGKITVTSTSFRDGGTIPTPHSSYDQNASPPLQWTTGPAGTQSYAILMEDPDAKTTPLPVIHWVVWNIPASATSLREGLETLDRLEDPDGLRQGVNSSGTVGYKGPRPPVGDLAHQYYIEVFALDRKLDLQYGAKRDDVLGALQGHVLAIGQLKGLFVRPDHPVKP
ncbi:MAG: YbhB/YbcL family Raf kinase inhibitor-like protein [Acidobacteriota bacterium]|nr:YbhB/YbcL family Raf kinase inhibitor-like protein [Acidobacteriota bacterium]